MGFDRDPARVPELRAHADNRAVLDATEGRSAHDDLGEVLLRFAASSGSLSVLAVGPGAYPALVATRPGDDVVVAAARGMRDLLVRAGPDGVPTARLAHEPVPELGTGWWRVDPFDPDVSIPDTEAELQRWFTAATR
jgi:hypothetical protein